jgi:hypothetical protein
MLLRNVDANFWTFDWPKAIDASHGFVAGNEDPSTSPCLWSVFHASVQMSIIERTSGSETFFDTMVRTIRAKSLGVATNGPFSDNTHSLWYAIKAKALGNKVIDVPISPSDVVTMGKVVKNGQVDGESRPTRAYIAWSASSGFDFDRGDPPTTADAAVGGLGPVILGGKASSADPANPNFDKFFAGQVATGKKTGNLIVARSPDKKFLLTLIRPHGADPAVSLEDLRDKLVSCGTPDAVYLDGGDSVTMFVYGSNADPAKENDIPANFLVRAAALKNNITRYGLGFAYEAHFREQAGYFPRLCVE